MALKGRKRIIRRKPAPPRKQSTDTTSSLASDVLAGRKKPTQKEIKTLAASVLGQDETRGKRKIKKRKP